MTGHTWVWGLTLPGWASPGGVGGGCQYGKGVVLEQGGDAVIGSRGVAARQTEASMPTSVPLSPRFFCESLRLQHVAHWLARGSGPSAKV